MPGFPSLTPREYRILLAAGVAALGLQLTNAAYIALLVYTFSVWRLLHRPNPRLWLRATHTRACRVSLRDIDTFRHLSNSKYLKEADFGRMEFILRSGIVDVTLDMPMVVGAAAVRFRKELRAFRAFVIRTRLVGWDERSLYFEQAFVSYKPVATAQRKPKAIDGKGGKPSAGRAESVAETIARRNDATGDAGEAAAPDVILHATVVSRLVFTNKGTTRTMFRRLGFSEAETPIPLPPPTDVAEWAASMVAGNNRVKGDGRLLGSRL